MDEALARAVGRRIASQRIRAGLSQRDLADSAGLAAAFISQLETGRRLPGVETLGQLAAALGCQVADFVNDPDELAARCTGAH